jgi:hypothetical protein
MRCITEAMDDFDEDDFDDFDDLPEGEDFEEGVGSRQIILDDCAIIMYYWTGSTPDPSYEILLPNGQTKQGVSEYSVIKCFLSNREKARGPLEMLADEIEHSLDFLPSLWTRTDSRLKQEAGLVSDCLRLMLKIVDGKATVDDLEARASESDNKNFLRDLIWAFSETIYEIFMTYEAH